MSRKWIRPPSFVCPHCGAESFSPMDIREGYCGRCHQWARVTNVEEELAVNTEEEEKEL